MAPPALSEFDIGFLVGVLVGEGHFGGDGRAPHVTLRMHTRHRGVFDRLVRMFPRSRLYGPYGHDGRDYLQWMVRGRALAEDLKPILDEHLTPDLDAHVHERYRLMCERYASRLRPA